MKKQAYIKPEAEQIRLMPENLLTQLSNTGIESEGGDEGSETKPGVDTPKDPSEDPDIGAKAWQGWEPWDFD